MIRNRLYKVDPQASQARFGIADEPGVGVADPDDEGMLSSDGRTEMDLAVQNIFLVAEPAYGG